MAGKWTDTLEDLRTAGSSLYRARHTESVSNIYKHLSENEYDYCPVEDDDGRILGKISVNDLEPLKDTHEIIENVLNHEEWIIFPSDMSVRAVVSWTKRRGERIWAALILKPDDTYDIITYDDIDQWLKKLIKLN